jgi:cobalamin-dependent methionine synthase I
MLAAAALSADGWQAVNLGPDTPFDALLAAAERQEPRVVWLCVSSVRDGREIEDGLARLAARLAEHEIALIVGGRAMSKLALPVSAAPRSGASLSDLVALANEVRDSRNAGTCDQSVTSADATVISEGSAAGRD